MHLLLVFLELALVATSAGISLDAPDIDSDEALSEAFAVFGRARKEIEKPHPNKHRSKTKRNNFLHGSVPVGMPPMPGQDPGSSGAAAALAAAASDAASVAQQNEGLSSIKKHTSGSGRASHQKHSSGSARVSADESENAFGHSPASFDIARSAAAQRSPDAKKVEDVAKKVEAPEEPADITPFVMHSPFDSTPASFDIIHRAAAKHSSQESPRPQLEVPEKPAPVDLDKHFQDKKNFEAWASRFQSSSVAASFPHFAVEPSIASNQPGEAGGAAAALASAASAAREAQEGQPPETRSAPKKQWWEVDKEDLTHELQKSKYEDESGASWPHPHREHVHHKTKPLVAETGRAPAKAESPQGEVVGTSSKNEGDDDPLSRSLNDAFGAFSVHKKKPAPVLPRKASTPLSRLSEAVNSDDSNMEVDTSASDEAIEAVRQAKQVEDARTAQSKQDAARQAKRVEDARTAQRLADASAKAQDSSVTTTTITPTAAKDVQTINADAPSSASSSSPSQDQTAKLTTYLKSAEVPSEVTSSSDSNNSEGDDPLSKLNDVFGDFAVKKDVERASNELAGAKQQLAKATVEENAAMATGQKFQENEAAQHVVEQLRKSTNAASSASSVGQGASSTRQGSLPKTDDAFDNDSQDQLKAYLKSPIVPSVASEGSTPNPPSAIPGTASATDGAIGTPAVTEASVDTALKKELQEMHEEEKLPVVEEGSSMHAIRPKPAVEEGSSPVQQPMATTTTPIQQPPMEPTAAAAAAAGSESISESSEGTKPDAGLDDVATATGTLSDDAINKLWEETRMGLKHARHLHSSDATSQPSPPEVAPEIRAIFSNVTEDEVTVPDVEQTSDDTATKMDEAAVTAPASTPSDIPSPRVGSSSDEGDLLKQALARRAAANAAADDAVVASKSPIAGNIVQKDTDMKKLWEETRQSAAQDKKVREAAGAEAEASVDQQLHNAAGGAQDPSAVSDDAIEKLWESTRKAAGKAKRLVVEPSDSIPSRKVQVTSPPAVPRTLVAHKSSQTISAPTPKVTPVAETKSAPVTKPAPKSLPADEAKALENALNRRKAAETFIKPKTAEEPAVPAEAAGEAPGQADDVLSGLGDAFGAYGESSPPESVSPPESGKKVVQKAQDADHVQAPASLPADEAAALNNALERRKAADTFADNVQQKPAEEVKTEPVVASASEAQPAVAPAHEQTNAAEPSAVSADEHKLWKEVEAEAVPAQEPQENSSDDTHDQDDPLAKLNSAFGAYSESKHSKAAPPTTTATPTIPADESAALEGALQRRQAAQSQFDATAPTVSAAAPVPSKSVDSASQEFDLSAAFERPHSPSQNSNPAGAEPAGIADEETAALEDGEKRKQQAEEAYDAAAKDVANGGWARENSENEETDMDAWQSMHEVLKRNHQLRGGVKPPAPVPRGLPTHHRSLPSWAPPVQTSASYFSGSSSSSEQSDDQAVGSAGLVGDLLGGSSQPESHSQDSDASSFDSFQSSKSSGALDALGAVARAAKDYQHTTALMPVDQTIHYGADYVDTGLVDDFKSRMGGDDW